MAKERVIYSKFLDIAMKENEENEKSDNPNRLYGVSDYCHEQMAALLDRHKLEWKFLNDEKVPSQIKQYFFELKLMLEGYSLGYFRTALDTCTSESLEKNRDKLFEFYTEQCGFSKIPALKVVDVIVGKKDFLPSCFFDENSQTWRTSFDDILYEFHADLFTVFTPEKNKFAFTSYSQDYIRAITFAKLLSDAHSSTSIEKYFERSKLGQGWTNMSAKDIESRKAKFRKKIGHWLDNVESDFSKLIHERTRNLHGNTVQKRAITEIDEEKSCLDGEQAYIVHRPIAELKFENEKIGFRIVGI